MTHVARQAHRWLPALVIISALSACDNVEWGGAEVHLEPPPPTEFGAPAESEAATEEDGPTLPTGPVLYVGVRDSVQTRLIPVAEIAGDSLLPLAGRAATAAYRSAFVDRHMAPGRQFVLFAGGTRVGTLTARQVSTAGTFCGEPPAVTGPVELVPEAVGASRFLALALDDARDYEHGTYRVVESDRSQHLASLDLTGDLIPQVGALWPTSLQAARIDLRAFQLAPGGPDAFASTFVFRDEMGIREAESSSWALFLMALAGEEGYRPAYVWYREAGREGRGVPLFWEHFDWDRDGETEILLEVLGEDARWTAAVARRGAEWQRIFQTPCGQDAPPVADDGAGEPS